VGQQWQRGMKAVWEEILATPPDAEQPNIDLLGPAIEGVLHLPKELKKGETRGTVPDWEAIMEAWDLLNDIWAEDERYEKVLSFFNNRVCEVCDKLEWEQQLKRKPIFSESDQQISIVEREFPGFRKEFHKISIDYGSVNKSEKARSNLLGYLPNASKTSNHDRNVYKSGRVTQARTQRLLNKPIPKKSDNRFNSTGVGKEFNKPQKDLLAA
ncbi:MAG: hypothetical protein KJO08_04735, partial [Gammaproteobacteria bacterium]|nr:hypothetical protein [Gammaproteobacteria bacterium]NNJ84205.1 hypothetical protein [Gammaproteobacteria bacterium]